MKLHSDDELCPEMAKDLKNNPEWISQATNFATVAAQYRLVTSQDLNSVAQTINNISGSKLAFEGTQQATRDIHIFNRLNQEAFVKSGHFQNASAAKDYFNTALENKNIMQGLEKKLTGTSQEVDWLRMKQGEIKNLVQKSELLNGNAPGVDGTTINRFTGKEISRTTIKATVDGKQGAQRSVKKIQEAIEKGNATRDDIIFGTKGTKQAAEKIDLQNKVIEKNTPKDIRNSNERLKTKIRNGKAVTNITGTEVAQKMAQGAVIGAAVSLSISSLTNYIKYKKGQISIKEAFTEIGEDTTKGAIIGSAMSGLTLFLSGGPLGFAAGMAIGMYLNASLTNILDEIFGKGAYKRILISSGYVMGNAASLVETVEKLEKHEQTICHTRKRISRKKKDTNKLMDEYEKILEEF